MTPRRSGRIVKEQRALPAVRAASDSTSVGRAAEPQGQPEVVTQFLSGAYAMFSTAQIAQPVEAFDHHGESDQQPNDQDAVGLVVADVLHAVAILAIVEAAILNLPAALGHAVETQAAQLGDREVGDPLGLNHRAIAFVLAVAQHAHGGPVEGIRRGRSSASQTSTRSSPSWNTAWGSWPSIRARTAAANSGRRSEERR